MISFEKHVFQSLKHIKGTCCPIHLVSVQDMPSFVSGLEDPDQKWMAPHLNHIKRGKYVLFPAPDGTISQCILACCWDEMVMWDVATLTKSLPTGNYVFQLPHGVTQHQQQDLYLGWLLGGYDFKEDKSSWSGACLHLPDHVDEKEMMAQVQGITFAQDLITCPPNHMGPLEMVDAGKLLAKRHQAQFHVIDGPELKKGFPAIYAVGKGSHRGPCLMDLRWGKRGNPKVTLVGKGVCFDTGGYNLKPDGAMKLMKKDMGGAGVVLGLAHALMSQNTPIDLRVLIPVAENSVSGGAMRPSDVIDTRSGKTVEVGHTDAEGRLILADALTYAMEDAPEFLLDMATLTGAARVALGYDIPVFFSPQSDVRQQLQEISFHHGDPLWPLPLWSGYETHVKGKVADLTNNPDYPVAGAITAALFLKSFVNPLSNWVHVDLMAYYTSSKPGRPEGGAAQGLKSIYAYLRKIYS